MQFSKFAKTAVVSAAIMSLPVNAYALDAAAAVSLNVRSGPGAGYRVVDTLAPGEVVDVARCNTTRTWCKIYHPGRDGWVAARYLTRPGGTTTVSPGRSDAATAAALATFLFGAAIIGGAIASHSDRPAHPPRPPRYNHHDRDWWYRR